LTPNATTDGGVSSAAAGTSLPANCIPHTIEEGDIPSELAVVYGVSVFDIMEANGLTEETATQIQIGDVLIIPLEGCNIVPQVVPTQAALEGDEVDAEATAEETLDSTAAPTPTPTVTLAPTAATAQVVITRVIEPGDVTTEGVEIRNDGALIELTGWTLSDSQGNTFEFPQRFLFTGGLVTVYSRSGTETSIALFWNRSDAVWEIDDVVTLRDANGVVQSTFRVQEESSLP
jgi:LysM repeat protein